MKDGGIRSCRGWGQFETGVHVEVEPFATALPFVPPDQFSPMNDYGCYGEGAFVEFDQPADLLRYYCGPRPAGFIPVPIGKLLLLEGPPSDLRKGPSPLVAMVAHESRMIQ